MKALVKFVQSCTTLLKGNQPTQLDIERFTNFRGYGAAQEVFESEHPDNSELKHSFINESNYDIAKLSCLSSFFTPDEIIAPMWQAVKKLNVRNGNALEPSCATGQFILQAPKSLNLKFEGIELDPTVGVAARALNPNAKLYTNQRFENANIEHSKNYSLVIGNPPYGDLVAHDKRFGSRKILDYFMLRSISELHEGGICCMVVSTWFMDSKNSFVRKVLSKNANLIAAARLPNDSFKDEGATLPTDVLVFQRSATPEHQPDWIQSRVITANGAETSVNGLFLDNPELVLGNLTVPSHFMHSCQVTGFQGDLAKALESLLDSQIDAKKATFYKPATSTSTLPSVKPLIVNDELDSSAVIGEVIINNGEFYQRLKSTLNDIGEEQPEFKLLDNLSAAKAKRMKAYITVKSALKALIQAEKDNAYNIDTVRGQLSMAYASYQVNYGALSNRSSKTVLKLCALYNKTRALELNYEPPSFKDGLSETYQLAPIFSKRVFTPYEPPKSANSYLEALTISINELGLVDIDRVAGLLDVTTSTAQEELIQQKLAFVNPINGALEDGTTYLSGNIKQKIIDCGDLVEFEANKRALQEVMPKPLEAHQITISAGSRWVPVEIYEDFARDLFGAKSKPTVALTDRFEFDFLGHGYYSLNTTTYGTERRPFTSLYPALLNSSAVIVRDKVDEVSVVNEMETTLANAKLDEIKDLFVEWVFNCPKRRELLVNLYNELFNVFAVPNYGLLAENFVLTGSNLSPYMHQKSAIVRSLLRDNTMYDMCVGSGKSLCFQGVAMTLRAINSKQRIGITMPNHLCSQFFESMCVTFPHANVVLLDESLSATEREQLLMNACVTDFDLIIFAGSTFDRLSAPQSEIHQIIEDDIAELEAQLITLEDKSFSTRKMQARLDKRKAELNYLKEQVGVTGVSFEDLELTALLVDEAQTYKNLSFNTQMQGVRGIGNPTGSKRAQSMYAKVRHVQRHGGKVIFGTGSTLSNTIIESVNWLRYLAPELKHTGLLDVDTFVKQFSEPQVDFDLKATGRGFKCYNTLKKYTNLTEIQQIYRQTAEVINDEDLGTVLPPLADGRPRLPPLKNGKVTKVILPISDIQEECFEEIVADAQHLTKENNMLAIMNRARKISLDPRLLDETLPRSSGNVVDKAVENIIRIHSKFSDVKGTQLVFLDTGIPARHKTASIKEVNEIYKLAENGCEVSAAKVQGMTKAEAITQLSSAYSVYDELESILTAKGLRVAVIHDWTKSPILKRKLRASFNKGEFDVLIGSTPKMASGWNLNRRLVALHNLDLPLVSGDLIQRFGRILRQNNYLYESGKIDSVEILTYSTKRTLDAWFASLLNRKVEFIRQFNSLSINNEVREYEPESEMISFSELSALVSGDQRMLDRVKAQHEEMKLSSLYRAHNQRRYYLESNLEYYKNSSLRITNRLSNIDIESKLAQVANVEGWTLPNGAEIDISSLTSAMASYGSMYNPTGREKLLAVNGDFKLVATKNTVSYETVYVVKGTSEHALNLKSSAQARALINAASVELLNIRDSYSNALSTLESHARKIAITEAELERPFKHGERLKELKAIIRDLDIQLAA